jgi:hypothetical protein
MEKLSTEIAGLGSLGFRSLGSKINLNLNFLLIRVCSTTQPVKISAKNAV